MTRLALVTALVFAFGCKKAQKADETKPVATSPAPTAAKTAPDGVRVVAINAGEGGYKPDQVKGKPGEKLKLQFTRTIDGECLSQLKTPDGKLVDLPMNKAVEVDVTVPNDGEVKFACGMDMSFLVVVADKG